MSSIWTPGGERPIRREPESAPAPEPDDVAWDDQREPTEEELQQFAQLQQQLAETPAGEVVANHCIGLFELARLHLSVHPPQLAEATTAIDALNAIVEALPGRLGQHEAELKSGLASLKLAFVQIRAANLGTAEPPSPPD